MIRNMKIKKTYNKLQFKMQFNQYGKQVSKTWLKILVLGHSS